MSVEALTEIVAALELGIFEQNADGGFVSVVSPPAWMAAFSRNPTFPFLGSFLPQAQEFWSEPRPGRLTWGPAAEIGDDGREFHFTVSAISLPGRKCLIFELDRNAETLRTVLQAARDRALKSSTPGASSDPAHGTDPDRTNLV